MNEQRRLILANSMINFLNDMCNHVNDEKKESLEVAIQCIESAFELTPAMRQSMQSVNIVELIPSDMAPINTVAAEQHKQLGNDAMRSSNYVKALSEYTLAIANNPNNAVYYCNRAAALTRLERNMDAVHDCRRALRLDPSYGKAYGRMGIAFSNMEMYDDARNSYRSALLYDATNEMYRQNMLTAEEHLNRASQPAIADARRMFDLLGSENFMQMASTMMSSPEFNTIMSRFVNMPPNSNFDVLLEAGSALASQLQSANPNLAEHLRTRFTVTNRNPETEPEPFVVGDSNENDDDQDEDNNGGANNPIGDNADD